LAEREVGAGLIAQSGPARLVQAIVERDEAGLTCRGLVPEASAFVRRGRAPAVVLLEVAAQATAVHQALASPAASGLAVGAPSRPSYLVAVRSASFATDEVAAGVPLSARVRRTGGAGALATYDVQVSGPDGALLLRATLSTHAGG
jgi:predicted hotdog family 3-hydroxylacyl-ACP dehydratase